MSNAVRIFAALLVFSLPAIAASPAEGIHNFYQVDSNVYRGAQPTRAGFRYLAKLGVKTVIDLRGWDDRAAQEKQVVTSLGMTYINVPMRGLTPPTTVQITKILALLEDTKSGAVFVHCKRGADRTGAVIAAYRIDHDQWDNARALQEAMSCGMSFFEYPRQNFIRQFAPLNVKQTVAASGSTASQPGAAAAVAVVPQP
jgi:tyrosine-protein phosphatase SIW14